jgi:outer membrane immunogenic protein
MKRTLTLGIGILTLAALPAFGADLPPRYPTKAPVMVTSVYNWSGCYIGGNVGGKWASTTDSVTIGDIPGVPGRTIIFDRERANTFIGGGQLGCNWQGPGSNWVLGLEGDVDWQRWRTTRVLGVTLPPFVAGDSFDVRSDWQASARARLGYAWDRTLLYITGGAAFTNVKVGTNFPVFINTVGTVFPATSAEDSKTLLGATFGGGFEHAFSNNWSFGVEARYSWYGTHSFNGGVVASLPTVFAPVTQTLKIETFEVTGRLNYKFDWGGPVVARY